MRAVFLKELRENAKWAGAIFAVIFMVVYAMMRRRNPYLMYSLAEPPMLVFVPLAGLLMGVVQTLFETRPDNWAFVVHRPVSRRAIFSGKILAGLLLLYAALELPCLIAAGWAARPGNLRMTFAAGMLLPSLALVLSAGCYYFVGMILALRAARWWGTRLLPVGFAVACSLAAWIAPQFWQALLIIAAGCGIGATAAWGAFSTGGAVDRGMMSRLGLGATMSVGTVALGVGVVGLSGIFQTTRTWSWWRLDRDGNVLRVATTLRGDQRTSEVTDTSGGRVAELSGVDLEDPAYASRFVRFESSLSDERLITWPYSTIYYGNSYRKPEREVVGQPRAAKAGVRMGAGCLYSVEGRIIEMYDLGSRRLVGKVGPAGFSAGRAEPRELFPGELLNPSVQASTHTLAFESAVYWMELDERRVRKIFTATPEDPVVAATELPPITSPTVIVGTRKHVYVMKPSGELISTAAPDPDLARNVYSVAMLPNHHLVMWGGSMSPTDARRPVVIELTNDPQAQVVRRTETPGYESQMNLALPRTAALGAVYPAAALPLFRFWQWAWLMDLGEWRGWTFQWWVLGSSVCSAAVATLLARRYGIRRWLAVGWVVTGLALGPAGVIALLGLNEMPARERCTACGGARWAGRRICPQCSAEMEPARAEGWEIFEPFGAAVIA